jgi:mRNA interferase MazF
MIFLNGEIWKVRLYPAKGSEQDGVRPCLIVSPDSMNQSLATVIVLPMTTQKKNWPSRIEINLNQKEGQACIEHIRSISKERMVEKLGVASEVEMSIVRKHLQATFSR